jgi:predicted RNase H-like HicB family nuclease
MEYRVGVEDMEPDNWVAYVFDLPGCFYSARTQSGAVEGVATAIKNYFDWRRKHVRPEMNLPVYQSFEIKIAEVFISYPAKEDPEYLVNAMFENDLQPIDMDGTLQVLDWNRRDLLDLVRPLSPETLNRPSDPRFGNIAGILKHIAGSEWWYVSRLNLATEGQVLPDDPFAALEISRANTLACLPELAGSARITEPLMSERWSPRKVIRRTLWHERDHIDHITQILASMK